MCAAGERVIRLTDIRGYSLSDAGFEAVYWLSSTTLGWNSVPATRRAMARSVRCPEKTLITGALLNSGRLTAAPCRIFVRVSAGAVTAGNSGKTRRGCNMRQAVELS